MPEEVALDLPTTIVSACPDEAAAEYVQDVFSNTCMRVYTNADIKGVELSGALKNVIALGVGISTGLGYGDNARAALITRGIAEIARLGVAMGCNIHTFAGLAGIGDLIVTATSMHSRNNRAGILIGKGKSPEQAVKEVGMVVEGHQCTACRYGAGSKVQCRNAHCADGERHREGGHERQRRAAHPDGPQPEERDAAGLRKSLNLREKAQLSADGCALFCCAACPLAENTK